VGFYSESLIAVLPVPKQRMRRFLGVSTAFFFSCLAEMAFKYFWWNGFSGSFPVKSCPKKLNQSVTFSKVQSTNQVEKNLFLTVISSVADPDPGSGAFLTPGSGMGKKSIGMNIPDREIRNSFLGVKYLNSLMRIRIRDSGSGFL
jgi:hypothetical protein